MPTGCGPLSNEINSKSSKRTFYSFSHSGFQAILPLSEMTLQALKKTKRRKERYSVPPPPFSWQRASPLQSTFTKKLIDGLFSHSLPKGFAHLKLPMTKKTMATAKDRAIKGLWPELPQGSNAKDVGDGVVVVDLEAGRGEAPNNNRITVKVLLTSRISPRFVTE